MFRRAFELQGGPFDGDVWVEEVQHWPAEIVRSVPDLLYGVRYSYEWESSAGHVYKFREYVKPKKMLELQQYDYDEHWGFQ